MTTVNDIATRLKQTGRRLLAAALSLELVASGASPAWAQRRKAEPEANPQFQQQLGGQGGGGGPVGEGAPAGAGAQAGEGETLIGGGAEEAGAGGAGGGAAQPGIQIGAAPVSKAAAPTAGSPLDARVTVRVKGAPLATFLDTISAQAKINFIITEGLETKRVTAFLQNVTVREALQVLLEIKGLSYQQIGKSNTYIVTPRSKQVENLITRIYSLSYIPLIPLDDSQGGGSGGAGTSGGAAAAPAAAPGSAPPAGGGGSSGAASSNVAVISVLQSVLSKLGQVATDPRTNSLIVTDVPEVFPQVEQIIAELDKKAPQVMIEAQIVEIRSDRDKELGIDWGLQNGSLATFTAGQRTTSFPMQLPNNLSKVRFLDPVTAQLAPVGASGVRAPISGAGAIAGGYLGSVSQGVLDLSALTVAVRALVTRSEGRFLGKPKVLTLNNKAANIRILRDQATSIQQTTVGGGAGITQSGNSVERHDTGVVLNVTPQVNKDGYITLLLNPRFIDTVQSSLTSASNPVIDPITRSASTLVRIKNGQTLVMGGLLQSTEVKTIRKVPFFGYIPLIGWLFSSVSAQRHNTDLVIFITPTIVND